MRTKTHTLLDFVYFWRGFFGDDALVHSVRRLTRRHFPIPLRSDSKTKVTNFAPEFDFESVNKTKSKQNRNELLWNSKQNKGPRFRSRFRN